MRLNEIVAGLDYTVLQGDLDREVSGIACDSREVVKNSLFVAISGFVVDGHQFIDQAIAKGARTIIVEKDVQFDAEVTLLKVDNTRKVLAGVSANFYQQPTKKLNLVGITGTNGKTSITYFLKSIFEAAQQKVGVIGSLGTVIGEKTFKNKNTTPESLSLQRIFAEMVEEDTQVCLMEVSSHALSLDRVAYSDFNTAIFTNLSPDHLELHLTMEEYFQAKASLFQVASDYHLVNRDDPYGLRLSELLREGSKPLVTYGLDQKADIYATDIRSTLFGSNYVVHTPQGSREISVHLPGRIYVYNSLAAIACAYVNGVPLSTIAQGIDAVEQIRGRFELVYREENYAVMIDFAHTEDALEQALTTLRPFTNGRLILVFGVYAAPGEKGRAKRRGMSQVAARHADLAIITSDNPKEQDPKAIIAEMESVLQEGQGDYISFVDREEAIHYAIKNSTEHDLILIAGKGHEASQVIGQTEIPFNEREIVLEAIRQKKQLVKN